MQSTQPKRYQQLQPEDRVTLVSLVQKKHSVRAIAQALGRSPSTISRELRRNTQPTGDPSAPTRTRAHQRRRQPRGRLHRDGILFALMHPSWRSAGRLNGLTRIFPKGHEHRVPHETIYNCIYAQPVGELKRERIATLRHVHNKCVRAARDKTDAVRSPTW
jgi:IS30 family transposase